MLYKFDIFVAFVNLFRIIQHGQGGIIRTFLTVVAPYRHNYIFNAALSAHAHCGLSGFQRESEIRDESAPTPRSAGKPYVFEIFVQSEVFFVFGFFFMVIIPVHGYHVVGHIGGDFFGNGVIRVIFPAVDHAQEHIRPHKRFETVFFRYFSNPVEMFYHHPVYILKAVQVGVFAPAYHIRLVHSYMHGAAFKFFF